jgi:hypothetical protein
MCWICGSESRNDVHLSCEADVLYVARKRIAELEANIAFVFGLDGLNRASDGHIRYSIHAPHNLSSQWLVTKYRSAEEQMMDRGSSWPIGSYKTLREAINAATDGEG